VNRNCVDRIIVNRNRVRRKNANRIINRNCVDGWN
jgi:hypothetical protein